MPSQGTDSSQLTIEAIIFDLGRVIVKLEPSRAFSALGGAASGAASPRMSADKIWAAIQKDDLWTAWQEGRVTPQQWHEHLGARFGIRVPYRTFVEAWSGVMVPEPDLLLPDDLLAKLASRYRLVVLSNTDPIHVECLEANFRFLRHFSARVYSCSVGACKPDPKIFQAAIAATKVPAGRTLYIDDVLEYVLAARTLGLQSIQYMDRAQLEADLRSRDLLPRD
jgi:FMN phosphatase YigB (HAD superfamily)